jgi:phosphotransferase system HPr (HPr) family protein
MRRAPLAAITAIETHFEARDFDCARRGSFTAVADTFIVDRVNVAEATVEIKNRLGLHLRAASALAQTVAKFTSQVSIGRGKNLINAKSVTGLMMLGAGQGSKLKIRVEGADAKEALKAVQTLFEDRFGEE